MNNVSWFLYLSDVLVNLQFVLVILSLVIGLGGGFVSIILSADYDRHFLWFINIPLLLICIFAAVAIPSKQTMYAIAASQVGEQIIQLEEVQDIGGEVGGLTKDVIQLLREQISSQLTEKPAESD